MAKDARDTPLVAGLARMLRLSGARPLPWTLSVIAVSLLLTGLDTLGVAAMVPLTAMIGGADADSGALGVIASIVGTSDPATLIPVMAVGIAVLFIVKSILALAFRWWMLGRTNRVAALASAELLERYLLAPYAAHRARQMSAIYRNVNQITGQAASTLTAATGLLTDLMLLTAMSLILLLTAPLVTGMAVAIFATMVIVVQRTLRARQSRIGEELAAAGLEAWSFMIPSLDGFREARLTSSANVFVHGFRRAKMRVAYAGRQMGIVTEAPRYALEIGFVLAIAGISLVLFTTGTPADALTVLGVFAAASLRGVPTLYRVAGTLASLRANRVALRILGETLDDLDAGGRHDESPSSADRYVGDITLRDVSYRYPDSEEPVLDGISLVIGEKSTTAFVGSSGAGKSTLLDLILGLLEPTAGTIECGGRPILDDRATWYSELGVVPQEVFVTNDTLASNVAFGVNPERIDRDRVHEVLAIARLEDLVATLPQGIETIMGERGVRLSGGQRQRLGLARALYTRPSVLVLDEATSALDNLTEHEITETLAGLSGTLTVIIVAHRLSTVRRVDDLVFLKDGRIEAKGTFTDVRRQSADFARLVELGDLS